MANIKYYFDLMSQPSRSLFIIMKMADIPFESCQVALRKGEQRTEEFKKLNRFQKVPFIHHGDFKLAESIAILRYLSKLYKLPENLYPTQDKDQARVDEFLEWHHLNIRLHCASYFMFKWLIPSATQSTPDPAHIETLESNMLGSVNEFEELFLNQGHKYITGDKVSAADIFAACELEQPRIAGYNVIEGRPRLQDWYNNVKKTCSPFYQEAHLYIDKAAKKALSAKL